MQKTDHSQFTSFVLSEFEQISHPKKPNSKLYVLWIGSLLIPIIVLILGILNGGEVDRRITTSLHYLFGSIAFFQVAANILKYAYYVSLLGASISLIIVILYLNPKTKEKVKTSSRYAILYLFVISFSFIDHGILQIIVNRVPFDPILSSPHPFFQLNSSFMGFWNSSFPNNNLTLSGITILLPVLFGDRSAIFKWIISFLSGILILFLIFTEIGFSQAWFTDVFGSLFILLFWSWFFYWHILFIKDREATDAFHKRTDLYYEAYGNMLESKKALDSGNIEECKKLLAKAKETYNQSISSIQNHSGNVKNYIKRNEFWKFYISLLMKDLENEKNRSRKWLYLF